MGKKIFLIIFILLTSINSASAETIRLQSGKVIEGEIVERTDDYIKVDTGIGIAVTYYFDEIKTDFPPPQKIHEKLKEKYDETEKGIEEESLIEEKNSFIDNSSPEEIIIPSQKKSSSIAKKEKKPVVTPKKQEDFLIEKIERERDIAENFGPKEHYLLTQIKRQGKLQLQNIKIFILATLGKNNSSIQKSPFIIFIPVGVVLYNLICFPLMVIAKKLEMKNSWMAWIPILQIFLFVRMGEKPWWWFLFLFIPVFGFFIYLILWMKIVISLRVPVWQGLLMAIPIVNVYVLWKFAFE